MAKPTRCPTLGTSDEEEKNEDEHGDAAAGDATKEDAAKEGGAELRADDNKHIRHYGSLGVEIQQQQPANPQSRV